MANKAKETKEERDRRERREEREKLHRFTNSMGWNWGRDGTVKTRGGRTVFRVERVED